MRSLRKVLIIIISLQACIEPFNPDISKYDDVLVVDATLTNESPAAVVKLTRSFPYNSNISKAETGAMVIISDENGTTYTLQEVSDGLYQSDESLKPVTGRNYNVHIVTSDGSEFESDYETMLQAAPIDSLYYNILINNPRQQGSGQNGVEISVDSNNPDDTFSRYYKWTWKETWEIRPPYPYPAEQKSCWQSQSSAGIHIETTENLVSNDINHKNLFFISTNQNKL
ncbi:MAG TPA: DUF4249 domain-containing protein, partial [Bacteroidales bacterium]|nr:DUF4249 domain-containing protein [Bacteroidales bacterium]